jgi:hypothetical protein
LPEETVSVRLIFTGFTATALLHHWLVEYAKVTLGFDSGETGILREMITYPAAGFRYFGPNAPP